MLTAEQINLPAEVFEALKGKVFTETESRTVSFYRKTVPVYKTTAKGQRYISGFTTETLPFLGPPVKKTLGEYGLNRIHGLIHENGLEYLGQDEAGNFLFYKDEKEFYMPDLVLNAVTVAEINAKAPHERDQYIPHPDGGYIVYTAPQAAVLKVTETTCELDFVNDPEQYNYVTTVNRVRQTVVVPDDLVASQLGLTLEQLGEQVYFKHKAIEKDPAENITSAFAIVTKTPNGYFTDLYVNEDKIDPATYGNKFTHYGKKTGVKLNYVMYNSCTAETAEASAGYEAGNFGACAKSNNHPWNVPIDFAFDLEREFAVLEARVCEQPETGKEYRVTGYFDVKAGEVIPRLHRKTGEGVVFI